MKTNPGGQLAPDEVFGRDLLIGSLWRILDRQSLLLTAERRMGKTSVIKKMVAEAPENKLPIYHDLEGIRSPLEFVEEIFHDVERYLSTLERVAEKARLFLGHLSGAEIKGLVKFPAAIAPQWKDLLAKTVEDLVENQNKQVVFFWDEMPLMLHNLKSAQNEDVAMEVLDVLRQLRQTHPTLRMVFTGSIGLHNVLSSLRGAGYANDPTNDMQAVDVPPLAPADARELARQLIVGEGLQPEKVNEVAAAVGDSVDQIPFFIHHVVDGLISVTSTPTENDVKTLVSTRLCDPQDPWHLGYFVDRIKTYYVADRAVIGYATLDALSCEREGISFPDLFSRVSSRLELVTDDLVREVVTLLQRDHYIIQIEPGIYTFRFSLIKRAWRLHRGLGL